MIIYSPMFCSLGCSPSAFSKSGKGPGTTLHNKVDGNKLTKALLIPDHAIQTVLTWDGC